MLEIVIIFIVVVLAFAAVVWYAVHSTRKRKKNSRLVPAARIEPELDSANAFSAVLEQEMTPHTIATDVTLDAEPTVTVSEQAINTQKENKSPQNEIDFKANDEIDLNIDLESAPELDLDLASEPEPAMNTVNDWDMVIAFTIMAIDGHKFSGEDIKFALENAQFKHGEMQIFHRLTTQNKTLFSVANILDPGTFDIENVTSMATPGILVFAKFPGPINGLALFDELLETSRTLTMKLSGILCDESRQTVTEDIIETMRSRILSLNFSMHSESNQDNHVY